VDGITPLLVIRHVPWEGPHTILDAFAGVPVQTVDVLASDAPLPAQDALRGAVVMGGPMGVYDTDRHPRLAEEIAWLRTAVDLGLPVLGVCLGSQLLAAALGADVVPGRDKELGFAPVEVLDASDPLLGALAPSATVLHWHGDVFALPPGATRLACSALTEVQAFRVGTAWGVLFHAEADGRLLERWLAEPTRADEAREVLGSDAPAVLRRTLVRMPAGLGRPVFAAFAAYCR